MDVLLNTWKVSLIVGCVVVLLVLLKPALRRRYHAKWKYYVWLALALALLLPLAPWSQVWFSAVGEAAPIQIEVPAVVPAARPGDAGTAVEPAAPVQQYPAADAGGQMDAGPVRPGSQEMPVQETAAVPVETILTWLWAAGGVLFALYHVVGTAVFCRRCLRWSRPPERAFVQETMAETCRELGTRRQIGLWITPAVETPMMIGLIRPQLLLPTEHYGERELGFILKHELTHYKRHDLWYKLALLAANAVHWFNPLAYLLVREANIDMELTCDDAVVAGADGETRRAYSETLLAAIHRQKGVQGAALSTHFYGGAETMKERFRNILGTGKRKRGVVALCAVLLLTAAAGCAIGFTSQRTVALDERELAEWEEKLNAPEWNGFVTHMYSDAKYISLEELLYNGAGISREMSEQETADYLAAVGAEELMTDVDAIAAQALADYLAEHTGIALEDFAAPLGWMCLEAYDTYYHMHGDTNFTPVEVVSGTRSGDTIALQIHAPGGWDSGMAADGGAPWEDGTLTITDGKVVRYTNALHTAVEAMALSGLLELEDSYRETMPVRRGWVEDLMLWNACDGESGAYYEWRAVFRLEPENGADALDRMGEALENGMMTCAYQTAVRLEEDGTVTQLESTWGPLSADSIWYEYLDMSFSEYCRYHYDYELDLGEGRQRGWPFAGNRLVMSIQNSGDKWTQTYQDVAKGWLMSYGDDLKNYEEVYLGVPETEFADQDVVLRAETAAGRKVLLLLNRVKKDYGIDDWADTVTYWEVAGYKLESGQELPEERLGQDYRRDSITLERTLEGETEQVPCFLYSGGGDYGLNTWSMYIPYEQWSCNYLANRWCPNQGDMATYIEVREHGADYTPEVFYDSYARQFEQVWTNQAVYGTNIPDTVTVAWAMGYQSAGGGRYTESYLFTGQGHVFEVLWTYAAEAAEGWGARMRWAADTFAIIGDDQGYITGELEQVKPGEMLVVEQEKDTDLIAAGTYLVLPNSSAYRLEDYFLPYIQNWMAEQGLLPYGQEPTGAEVQTGPFALAYTYDQLTQDQPVLVFDVDWDIDWEATLTYGAGGTAENPQWQAMYEIFHVNGSVPAAYLAVEHNGEYVTRTTVMLDSGGGAPGDAAFTGDLQDILNGMWQDNPVTEHTTHPAIFYDRAAEELYAVSTQTAQLTQ